MVTIAGEVRLWTMDLWKALAVVWIAGLVLMRPAIRRQSGTSRFWHIAIVALGLWLLFAPSTNNAWLDAAAVPSNNMVEWAGLALTFAGVAFAIWARIALGGNWSGTVSIKQGHSLMRRGPYRIVRHPIYSGLLLACGGTALTRGSVHSLLALPVCAFGLWLKLTMEERFMVEQFGDQYLTYRREVQRLVPYVF